MRNKNAQGRRKLTSVGLNRRFRVRAVRFVARAWPIVITTLSCANLPNIEANRCGNFVIEAGEQCDGYAPEGLYCRPASDAENPCQYACNVEIDGKTRTCPEGSACGTQGLCRFGTGKYAPWGEHLTASAAQLLLGDFDGDGRDDIVTLGNASPLWESLPTLSFLDDAGHPVQSFNPKIPIRSPQVQKLGLEVADSKKQQLLFSTREGLASLSASENRVVLPDAYPYQSVHSGSRYRILPISGMTENALGDGILVFYGEPDKTRLIGAESSLFITELLPIEEFVGDLVAADVDDRPTSPCSELLFAYRNQGSIYSLDPCSAFGTWTTWIGGPHLIATLPEGHVVSETLLSSDLDADGHTDIVVGDETGQIYVGFGLGDGRVVGDPTHPDTTEGELFALTLRSQTALHDNFTPSFPLALGDLDADGRPDWVYPDGVLLTSAIDVAPETRTVTLTVRQSNEPFVGQWAIAQVGDFNRDGFLDLAAAAKSEPDLDFFLGTGLPMMNRFGISTEGAITHLTTGDFDGDLTRDLAFSVVAETSIRTSDSTQELVYIAFGTYGGAPTEATAIGTFHNIRQMSSAHYVDSDAMSELGVVSESASGQGEELAVFVGNAGRHPIAPLGLSVMTSDGHDYWGNPLTVTAGRFYDAGNRSTIALGVSCEGPTSNCTESFEYRLWYTEGSATSDFSIPTVSVALPDEFTPFLAPKDEFAVHLVAGDLDDSSSEDAQSRDELLILATTSDRRTRVSLWPVQLGTASTTFSTHPDDAADVPSILGKRSETKGALFANSNPTLVDLNGDHYRDLAFLVHDETNASAVSNQLVVVLNERGKLDLAVANVVDLDGEIPFGIFGRTDKTNDKLLAITQTRVFEVTAEKNSPKATEIPDLPGGKAIATGDLTGYGLNDLVIASEGLLYLFAEGSALSPPETSVAP